MTPAERQAVAKAVRIASAGATRKARQRADRDALIAKFRSGQYLTPQDRRQIAAGFDIGVHGLVGKTFSNLLEAAANTPAGVYELGKASALDHRDLLRGDPGFKRSRKLAKAIGESTVQTVRHPLRRPGDTLLLGVGALTGGAGLVSRTSAAGSAARAASAAGTSPVRAALTRPGFQGGSLLSRPIPGVRVHRVGDLEVRGRYSASPAVRGVQKAKDRLVERSAGTAPGEAYAIRKAGKELGQNRRVAEDAARGPAKRLARMGRRLTGPQQQALRVWGQGLTVDEKINQYRLAIVELADAELPDHVKETRANDLARRIALTDAARGYLDDAGEIADFQTPRQGPRRGASPKHLRAVARQARRVAGDTPGGRERVLLEAGLIEPEQAAFRLHAPGRIAKGATWTTAAQHAVQQLDRIERERRKLKPKDTVVPGAVTTTERPRTRKEWEDEQRRQGKPIPEPRFPDRPGGLDAPSQKRLDDLNSVLDPLIASWAKEVRGQIKEAGKGGSPIKSKEAWVSERHGKKGREVDLPPEDQKVWEIEQFGYAQGDLGGYRNRHANSPEEIAEEMLSQLAGRDKQIDLDLNTLLAVRAELAAQGIDFTKLRKALDERDELLRRAADAVPSPDEAFAPVVPREPEPDYGTVAVTRREPDRTVPGELDEASIAALAELDRQEMAAFYDLDRGDQAKLVGQEDFEGGRFRVPDVPQKLPQAPMVGRGSVYRGGIPRPPKSITEGYTGALEQTGGYRVKTTRVTAESALEAHKYRNVLDLRRQILRAGQKQRPADTKLVQWVPVRKQRLTAKQRRMLTESQPHPDSETGLLVTDAERASVGSQWERFLEDVFPEKEFANVQVGASVPNVVWVPRQMLANMNRPFQRSPWAPGVAVLDTALNLVKFGVIPLKTAYVTANAAGNLLFNVVQQGVFLARNWKQAVTLLRDERTASVAREVMGSGGMQALVSGNPKGSARLNQFMHAYGNVASELMLEPMMRLSALVHEMNRFGHKTTAQQYRLLTDPKMADERNMIVRRGKDAIIDYDRLGPLEKAVVRRALFIYPWVKGATLYGGHFLMEHPVQAAVYSQLANVGREQAERDLGPVPSYARGSFKVGGTDDMPLVVNPATISPFSQAAEIGHAALGSLKGGGGSADQVGGLLHPGIQAAIEAGFKRDQFTGAPLQGSFLGLLAERSLKQTAPAVLAENLAKADRPPGRRAFPMTQGQALLRSGVGSFMPRTANRKVLNEAARTEREHGLTPAARGRRTVFRERREVFEAMKRNNPELLRDGRLPAPVRKAYNRKAEVEAARRQSQSRAHGDSLTYYRNVAVAEAKLLERWGALPKGSAARIEKRVANMELEAVRDGVRAMRDDLMPDAYRDITSAGTRYLERTGG